MKPNILLTSFTVVTCLAFAAGPGWPAPTHPGASTTSGPREKAPELEGFEPITWLGGVHFDFDKSNIRPAVLACRGASAPCWQKNRRADFLVKSTDKQSP